MKKIEGHIGTSQLGKVKKLLEEDNATPNIVIEQLGNNVSAILSVPLFYLYQWLSMGGLGLCASPRTALGKISHHRTSLDLTTAK